MNNSTVSGRHEVVPFRAADKRARCRLCNGVVVGTPAGWFHADEQQPVPPWPEGHPLPTGAPLAVDVIEEVLQDAFKGTTGVDLRDLAAQCVDALQGDELRVELRWFDETEENYTGAGVYVLTDGHGMSLRMRVWSSLVHHMQSMERALWLPPDPSPSGEKEHHES